MPQLITTNFRVYQASEFVESFADTSNNSIYTFIGRSLPWADENSPPSPSNNFNSEREAWESVVSLKKVNSNDVRQVIPRYDWAAGTIYARYNDRDTNLFSKQFYVLVLPEYKVYLCIDNNNGRQSSVKPTGISTSIFNTADGYKWKYLYSLSDTDILKFLTRSYMPVNINSDVSAAAVGGQIQSFIISDGGSDYSSTSTLTLQGNGSNFAGTPIVSGGSITGVTITNPGSGYSYANVTISGTGSNALLIPILSPYNGHGKDLYENLGAFYVTINTRLNYSEGNGDFPVLNEYRTVGLIKNPLDSNSNVATSTTLCATTKLIAAPLSGTFSLDESLVSNVNLSNVTILSANVVSPNVELHVLPLGNQLNNSIAFSVGNGITGQSSGATGRIRQVINPEVKRFTGKVLYIENRPPITRSYDQAENIHIVIEF